MAVAVVSFQIDQRRVDLMQLEQYRVRQDANIQFVQAVQLHVAVTDV